MRASVVLATLVLGLVPRAFALYEDEVGSRDWHTQLLGIPHLARARTASITVGTDRGVVASLSAKRGALRWRAVLPEGEELHAMEMVNGVLGHVTTVSVEERGCFVRTWHGADGGLIWDAFMPLASPTETRASLSVIGKDASAVGVGCGGSVAVFEVKNGAKRWEQGVGEGKEVVWVGGGESEAVEVGVRRGRGVEVVGFGLEAGEKMVGGGKSVECEKGGVLVEGWANGEGSGAVLGCGGKVWIGGEWVDVKDTCVASKSVGAPTPFPAASEDKSSAITISSINLLPRSIPLSRSSKPGEHWGVSGVVVAFEGEGGVGGGELVLVRHGGTWQGVGCVGRGKESVGGVTAAVNEVEDTVVLTWGAAHGLQAFPMQEHASSQAGAATPYGPSLPGLRTLSAGPRFSVSSSSPLRAFAFGNKALVVTREGMVVFGDSKTAWERDEAQSRVAAAAVVDARGHPRRGETVDLSDPALSVSARWAKQLASCRKAISALQEWATSTFSSLTTAIQNDPTILLAPEAWSFQSPFEAMFGGEEEDKGASSRDRVILLASPPQEDNTGRVWAKSMETGETLWTMQVPKSLGCEPAGEAGGENKVGVRLDTLRVAAIDNQGPLVALTESSVSCTRVSIFDAWASTLLSTTTLPTPMPFTTSESSDPFSQPPSHTRPLLLVSPTSILSTASSPSFSDKTILHVPCITSPIPSPAPLRVATSLCGFHLNLAKASTPPTPSPVGFSSLSLHTDSQLEVAWSVAGGEGESLVAWVPALDDATRDAHADTSASAFALGDDSVLRAPPSRYIALAVFHNPDTGTLTAALVEAATGHRLWTQRLKEVSGPIASARLGEMLVFTAWNKRAGRSELTSIFPHGGAIGTFELNPFHNPPPSTQTQVLSQTFILPLDPTVITDSHTRAGISRRRLLVASTSGSVLQIESRLVDPRRPAPDSSAPPTLQQAGQALQKAATPEAKEGLLPYSPFLPLRHMDVITYNRTIARPSLLISAPADVESSTFVLTAGIDLAGARLTLGAKAFDEMDPGYSKPLVAAIFTVVAILVPVLDSLLRSKRLNDAWK